MSAKKLDTKAPKLDEHERKFIDTILGNEELIHECYNLGVNSNFGMIATMMLCSTQFLNMNSVEDIISDNTVSLSIDGLRLVWNHLRPDAHLPDPKKAGMISGWYEDTINDWHISQLRSRKPSSVDKFVTLMAKCGYKVIE